MTDFDTQRALQKNRIRRRGIYLLPNLFTTAALFAGFYAIVQAMNFRFGLAAVAIFVAMVLDGLDGRVARLTRTQSAFGAEYDSLSDMVSFGAAPALIVYEWALKGMGNLGWIAAFVYVAGAALRLARDHLGAAVPAEVLAALGADTLGPAMLAEALEHEGGNGASRDAQLDLLNMQLSRVTAPAVRAAHLVRRARLFGRSLARHDEAIADLREALTLDPNQSEVL